MNFKFRELLLIFAVIIMLSVSFGIASVTAEKITEKAKKNTVASPELKVTVETTKEANKTNVNWTYLNRLDTKKWTTRYRSVFHLDG